MKAPIVAFSLFLLLASLVFAVPTSSPGSVSPAAGPDFTITAFPSNLTITAGSSGFATINVTGVNGFFGNVTLSISPPPAGFGVGISPVVLQVHGNGTARSQLTVNDSFNGTTTFQINITGMSGSLSHTTAVGINGRPFVAPTFMISGPNLITVAQGSATSASIVVSSKNNFNGTVSMSPSIFPSVANGPAATLSPATVNVPPGGSAVSTLTIAASSSTLVGFYNYTISGIAAEGGGFLTESFTGSVQVLSASQPDFRMSAIPSMLTIKQGSSGQTAIVVTSFNGFSGIVNLTPPASCLALGCPQYSINPMSVSVSPGQNGTAIFTISTSPQTPPGTVTVSVTGTSGQINHSAPVTYTVLGSGPPDFTISASPQNQTVPAGQTATSTIIVTSVNGFNGTVRLTTSPPPLCPSCPGWQMAQSSVNVPPGGSATATLVFTTTVGTPPTAWTVTVTGTSASGSLSHSVNVGFVVVQSQPDFFMGANPPSLVIPAGTVATSTIILTSLNGFNGTVSLQTSPSPTCPSPMCTVWSISPTIVFLPPGGTANATLTILAGTLGGSGNVTVFGSSGNLSHFTFVLFKVSASPDFTISAFPSHVQFPPGSSASVNVTVTALNGFNGTVFFSLSSSPGLLANISPHNVTVSGHAQLTLSAGAAGNYTCTVTGTSGSLSHSVTVFVNVAGGPPPDFGITAAPSSLGVSPGSSASSTITVSSLNNFNGTVTLTASSSSSAITASLSRTAVPIPPGGSGSSVLTVSTTTSTPSGTYTVIVIGSSGLLVRSTTVTVTVTAPPPPPDFTINIVPENQTVHRGSTASYTIMVRGTNGFNNTVTMSATITPLNRHGPSLSLPSTVGPYSNSVLAISTGHNTPQATYTIIVKATSGTLTHTFSVTLTVLG